MVQNIQLRGSSEDLIRCSNPNNTSLNCSKEDKMHSVEKRIKEEEDIRPQPFDLNKCHESQVLFQMFQRDYQNLAREMEILIHVKDDLIIFVKKVMEKAKKREEQKVYLPVPQYIDYFQKIKYAFNLLGKTSHFLEQSSVQELVCSFFQSLEYVIYYCPDGKTLPKQINSPLLTDNAINLLKKNLENNQIEYWKELDIAWNISRNNWPSDEAIPPAYTPTFYDGWKLPEIHHEPVKTVEKD